MGRTFLNDLTAVPFSRRGNYFCIKIEDNELLLRDVRREGSKIQTGLFKIKLLKNQEIVGIQEFNTNNTKEELLIKTHEETCEALKVTMGTESSCNMQVKFPYKLRLSAMLSRYDTLLPLPWPFMVEKIPSLPMRGNAYEFHSYKCESKYLILSFNGKLEVNAPWDTVGHDYCQITLEPYDEERPADLILLQYRTVPKSEELKKIGPYEDALAAVKADFKQNSLPVDNLPGSKESLELASYILWSNEIAPCGLITRPALYMSKNYMNNIWSWDNVFNAIAEVRHNPQLALNQFLIFMDHQDISGAYPDYINTESLSYACVKPPVHAWALTRLVERNPEIKEHDEYSSLVISIADNLDYWFFHRRLTKSCIPWYKHGNDSGWDNASIFHKGMPVQSPDLAVHLIRSCDYLVPLLEDISETSRADHLHQESMNLLKALKTELLDDAGFFAKYIDGSILPRSSLLLYYPILILDRFDTDLQLWLLTKLEETFLVPAGLATEDPKSDYFNPDGYWLGPVWAPSTYLIYDALREYASIPSAPYQSKAMNLAKVIAEHFCWACETSGMAENYHPITAESQSDPAFAWPSSVYLLMQEDKR